MLLYFGQKFSHRPVVDHAEARKRRIVAACFHVDPLCDLLVVKPVFWKSAVHATPGPTPLYAVEFLHASVLHLYTALQ